MHPSLKPILRLMDYIWGGGGQNTCFSTIAHQEPRRPLINFAFYLLLFCPAFCQNVFHCGAIQRKGSVGKMRSSCLSKSRRRSSPSSAPLLCVFIFFYSITWEEGDGSNIVKMSWGKQHRSVFFGKTGIENVVAIINLPPPPFYVSSIFHKS